MKSDLLDGLIQKQMLKDKRKKKKERKKLKELDSGESDSSMSEERIQELEKALTPLERERLAIKQ